MPKRDSVALAWGFFDAKAFFAVVREGVADKPG